MFDDDNKKPRKVAAREALKHDLNELFDCLDCQKDTWLLNKFKKIIATTVECGWNNIWEQILNIKQYLAVWSI